MTRTQAPDRVGAAIAAAEAPAEPPALLTITVTLGTTGRKILLGIPRDLSAMEALDLCGYVARGLPEQLAEANRAANPASQLLVPGGLIRPKH